MHASAPANSTDPAAFNGAAGFLLELAGQGTTRAGIPSFGLMQDRPDGPKYLTQHRPLTTGDCRNHLAGRITVAAHMRLGVHCRCIAFDADTSADFSVLRHAATLLRASGAWPLLEQTALPPDADHAGGGRLWIVFRDLVVPAHAIATAERFAPTLRGIRERFPARVPVRLPGGLYRRGYDVWSELGAVGSDDDGWYTGAAAITTIQAHLTPATWVQPIESAPGSDRRPQARDTMPPVVYEGDGRNRWIFTLACALRRFGLTEHELFVALTPVNTCRCSPPLDQEEYSEAIRSASRYPPADALRAARSRRRPGIQVCYEVP